MDLGVFLPIANNGWICSSTSPQYMPTFSLNKSICIEAERGGFDFALSMVKFRGDGGLTEYWDHAMDSFSLMAGLAEATSTLQLYASAASLTMHPAMTARMVASIDDISGGRFGVNMVAGFSKLEYASMGLWPGDEYYATRYDYSTEYVEVMRALWTEGRVTHKGTYFELDDCFCQPLPSRRIPVMSAGQSPRGMQFAAEVGDYNFVVGDLIQLRALRGQLDQACATSGRPVGAYALFGIIAAETDAEAVEQARHYLAGTDYAAIDTRRGYASGDTKGSTAKVLHDWMPAPDIVFEDPSRAAYVQGGAFLSPQLVGSYDQVAAYLDAAALEAGMAGVIMTFADFVDGTVTFSDEIIPRMATRRAVLGDTSRSFAP
jgi:pyrimidine oxygenase